MRNLSHDSRAVLYLRVSTKDQAQRGGELEGFSIPAQREACRRKAESMGATVISEFVDAGESARSTDRPELQRMLLMLSSEAVDFVIVHKVDRLARNRVDDVEINVAIQKTGARLVSVTENIDETPSGMLMHGIMSSIAEFYSRNLANEVVKGMQQKVQSGGTTALAPIGYENVRKVVGGREVRTVQIDRERAEHIVWAFSAYSSGEWSLRNLAAALESRGLVQKATAKRAERPLRPNRLQTILRNRYYLGFVSWKGVEHVGQHEPLVSPEVFEQVQKVLDAHRQSGERPQKHHHYLIGSLHCARCDSKMIYSVSKGNGGAYQYFVCLGHHSKTSDCALPYLSVETVEKQVVTAWHREKSKWNELAVRAIESTLADDLRAHRDEAAQQHGAFTRRIEKIQRERLQWAEKAMDGLVPDDIARNKQSQLGRQLGSLQEQQALLDKTNADYSGTLARVANLIRNCGDIYERASDRLRRDLNQSWFNQLRVDETDGDVSVSATDRTRLMATLHQAGPGVIHAPTIDSPPPRDISLSTFFSDNENGEDRSPRRFSRVRGANEHLLVELRGLEPLTPTLPVWCATSCAIAPYSVRSNSRTRSGCSAFRLLEESYTT